MIHPFKGGYEEDPYPCAICGKRTKGTLWVKCNHERGDWPKPEDQSHAQSLYPVGPNCARKLQKQGTEVIKYTPSHQ